MHDASIAYLSTLHDSDMSGSCVPLNKANAVSNGQRLTSACAQCCIRNPCMWSDEFCTAVLHVHVDRLQGTQRCRLWRQTMAACPPWRVCPPGSNPPHTYRSGHRSLASQHAALLPAHHFLFMQSPGIWVQSTCTIDQHVCQVEDSSQASPWMLKHVFVYACRTWIAAGSQVQLPSALHLLYGRPLRHHISPVQPTQPVMPAVVRDKGKQVCKASASVDQGTMIATPMPALHQRTEGCQRAVSRAPRPAALPLQSLKHAFPGDRRPIHICRGRHWLTKDLLAFNLVCEVCKLCASSRRQYTRRHGT